MNEPKGKPESGNSNRDERVILAFGDEWSRFSQDALESSERSKIFDDYFRIFPWTELPKSARGADIGCGSGRWAVLVAPRVAGLTCVDASRDALEVAKKNLAGHFNVNFVLADVGDLPFNDNELDFAYSLGVLHHVPDTLGALKSISRSLKQSAPFLIYLYYAFDNRSSLFRTFWRISNVVRQIVCRSPKSLRFFLCDVIALAVYWPISKLVALLARSGVPVHAIPLAYYRDKSLYVMRTDALDRFGTRLEKRFTKKEFSNLLERAGFHDLRFASDEPFWCAVARKR